MNKGSKWNINKHVKKGNYVRNDDVTLEVLSRQGKNNPEYPCFTGVVIKVHNSNGGIFFFGMLSNEWSIDANWKEI